MTLRGLMTPSCRPRCGPDIRLGRQRGDGKELPAAIPRAQGPGSTVEGERELTEPQAAGGLIINVRRQDQMRVVVAKAPGDGICLVGRTARALSVWEHKCEGDGDSTGQEKVSSSCLQIWS